MTTRTQDSARPSRWWLLAAATFAVTAVIAAVAAVGHERDVSRPIGEGRLFHEEAAAALDELVTFDDGIEDGVRKVRNDLEIEAVSVVSPDGVVSASSSETLIGTPMDNPVTGFAHSRGAFAAAAIPIANQIEVDGVVEWNAGDTVYSVIQPIGDGRSILLHYDISGLLARRTRATGIAPETLVILGLGALSTALAGLALLGRARAAARFRSLQRETELLRTHSVELEERNLELDAARKAAEEALALAEEKNRIRAEFVLMINHELRTPLTSVITGAQLLAEEGLAANDRTHILDDMLRDGQRLEEMISQILAVARIENRGLTSTVVDVTAADVWARIGGALPTRVAKLFEMVGVDGLVRTDPDTVAHLVASLVDNAFQHGASDVRVSAHPSVPLEPSISVGTDVEAGMVILVEDDGPGIDPAFLPRIFEKFEKDSFSSGTGLGLYVVRLMAEAIECRIGVVSSANGTTFQVIVPASTQGVVAGVAA